MRVPYGDCDEKPVDDDVAVTASRDPHPPDAERAAEPPAEETTAGEEEAGYGYGV
jgi:hypothetical protein